MRFRRYIQGSRRGREANRLERQAMHDPFLAEALEGYDRVKDDPMPRIDLLRRKIRSRNQRRLDIFKYGGIAASLLFILGFGIYFGFHRNNLPADVIAMQETIEQETLQRSAPAPAPEDALAQNNIQSEQEAEESSPPPVPAKAGSITTPPPPPPVPVIEEVQAVDITEDMAMDEISAAEAIEEEITAYEKIEKAEQREPSAKQTAPAGSQATQQRSRKQEIASPTPFKEKNGSEPVKGFKKYKKYIEKKMIRPTDDCKDIKGEVILSFLVDADGKPYAIQTEQSLCSSADKEAIRLIKEGPLWKPSETRTRYTIRFND